VPSETKMTLEGWRPSNRKPPSRSAKVNPIRTPAGSTKKIDVMPRSRASSATPYPAEPKKNRLAKAHDPRIPPNEVEGECEQAQDQHARGVDGQIVRKHQRQNRYNRQNDQFYDRQLLPSKSGPRPTRDCQIGHGCRLGHQAAQPGNNESGNKSVCCLVIFSIPLDRPDRHCGPRSRSFRPSRRRCTSSSCSDAAPAPFPPARPDLRAIFA